MKFYKCEHCGNIVYKVEDKGVPVVCCGEKMKELVAGEKDASLEKHVPVVNVEGNIVKVHVGSVDHPMVPEHFIEWVAVKSSEGVQFKKLSPESEPEVSFALKDGEKPEEVYAYCNLHGLWKA